ncbi:predicted protein [Pyrenophora tritici-repentis Pt-1C-BFP]|uniref:Uncharacterized protein n=1 Tax=Pyrenophora tritici-repentis (strain Pt-1C-BFP) TaxID=426418 RepID=B2VXD6_PYRTR|nr:uncharacterized protein PTRG_03182 [Pyrenophora tritici-repentis Pt-1C-BFP]EDU45705.1 predicted protein [Pyrenophora tritici-repentis Pt-1C-BFP]
MDLWRKLQGSRPQTPVSATPFTPVFEDTDEARNTSKPSDFSEPWSEDAPPIFPPYVDPLEALQAVRLHMVNSCQPIPLEHYNGLFRIFEDYRKAREQKERIGNLMEVTLQDWEKAEEQWRLAENRYVSEIRRLELLIVRGTGALLHRPASPSGKMIILSKHLADNKELPVGAPSELNKTMLSRKVQSELNLTSMRNGMPSITSSVTSGFSGGSGDPLPDEAGAPDQTHMDPSIECDALVALPIPTTQPPHF